MLLCHSFRWRLFSTDKIVIIADTKKKFLLNLSNLEMIFSFHHIWSILLVLYYMLVFDVCIYICFAYQLWYVGIYEKGIESGYLSLRC